MLKKYLCTFSRVKPITFNLPGYSLENEDGVSFYSEPFNNPGGTSCALEWILMVMVR